MQDARLAFILCLAKIAKRFSRELVSHPKDWRWSSYRHWAYGVPPAVEIESTWKYEQTVQQVLHDRCSVPSFCEPTSQIEMRGTYLRSNMPDVGHPPSLLWRRKESSNSRRGGVELSLAVKLSAATCSFQTKSEISESTNLRRKILAVYAACRKTLSKRRFSRDCANSLDRLRERLLTVLAQRAIWLANACGATRAGCETRVSRAVTRMAPGQTLRPNGSTARAKALFSPLAATSARSI